MDYRLSPFIVLAARMGVKTVMAVSTALSAGTDPLRTRSEICVAQFDVRHEFVGVGILPNAVQQSKCLPGL